RALLARGHAVRALVRDVARVRGVLPEEALDRRALALVTGDALDPGAVRELTRGCGAVVHLVGIIRPEGGQTFHKLHVEATRNVIGACQATGADRLIHVSALGIGPEGASAYQKTKWEAEVLVRRSGLAWTIFRPSFIHGPEGEFVQMVKGMASGQEPPWYFMPYFTRKRVDDRVPLGAAIPEPARVQPVAVEDVAEAVARALENPRARGEIYNLVGPDVLAWPELLRLMRDGLPGANHGMPIAGVPGDLAMVAAKVAAALGLGNLMPYDAGQAIMAMQDSTAETSKVRAHLGLTPRPFAETFAAYAARA
ncbi:MAG TPA: NAD(P)H-binding protein, partial [Phycisphaerales bacterium]|nr:NAD(P)H-binding protein [Phycisphaerales bacterium]